MLLHRPLPAEPAGRRDCLLLSTQAPCLQCFLLINGGLFAAEPVTSDFVITAVTGKTAASINIANAKNLEDVAALLRSVSAGFRRTLCVSDCLPDFSVACYMSSKQEDEDQQ